MKLLFLLFSGLKFLKFGKLFATGGSMLLSVAAYALVFGWRYAAGFVALILVHELGHYVAARQRGLDVGAPVFIPFVGAWIQLKDQPRDADTEAYVGLGGPFAGTLASLLCYFAARETGSNLLLALSYAGFFINLFNLIPLSPFDGGRITAVLTPRVWLVGVPVLAAVFLWRPSPILVLVALLAIPNVVRAFKYDPGLPENQAYYGVSLESRLTYGSAYLALVCLLAVMAHDVHDMLGGLRGQ
ncbi:MULTISPECIES: site-2 protease family protein [unclassified Achromobacter]|jgi:Zn-dependent protease|uniref:site-2 protease family protein n=1 Tax=unclassified Achromobacter TaxID=2626865 RepID=UPI00069D537E|nr:MULTISPECIES: site-2 protease family protein [unclassified Achromobacter]KOF53382.1 peptidase M50 [Achromobacter sp. DMS1]